MGQLKALLPFGAHTVIEQVVQTLLHTELEAVYVVLGHRAREIATVLERWPVHLLYNIDYRYGMTTSVQVALRHVIPVPDAYLLALVDQPQIGVASVQQVLAAYRRVHTGLVIPTSHGKRGHPIVLAARYRQEILALGRDQGLHLVTRGHPEDTTEMPLADDAILRDMDYREEYEAELQRWHQRSALSPCDAC
jgi:molybdenum cofactor cytidylyltransferase